VFAASGVFGAALGSSLANAIDAHKLLFLFAIVMFAVVGIATLHPRVLRYWRYARSGLVAWKVALAARIVSASRRGC
jgi:uncharacterized membrane protein YfcA